MEENLMSKKRLTFHSGSNCFRQRLSLSVLSARPVKISEIRSGSDFQVGLADYEVSFIHLLDKLCNGSKFKISETGTEVSLTPGALLGGTISHDCHPSRPLSYYLEPVMILAPFCKKPLRLTLKGKVQNEAGYNSVYKMKHAAFPIMEMFGIEPMLEVKARKFEESEVLFTCTVKKQLLTLRNQLNQESGKVRKVRGLAYGFRISPQMLNRVITSAKDEFLPFLNDVFIINDPVKQSKSKSPGYGLVLYAETTKNITYAADGFVGKDDLEKTEVDHKMNPLTSTDLSTVELRKRNFNLFPDEDEDGKEQPETKKVKILSEEDFIYSSKSIKHSKSPEDLGSAVAKQLLQEITTESRIDSVYQWLVLGYMSLGPKDVTSAVMGPLTPFTVQYLRDIKTFFGVTFKIENYYDFLRRTSRRNVKPEDENDGEEDDDDTASVTRKKLFKLSCLGSGYINLNKTMV